MHLAEINVARLRHSLDDPRVADFVDNLDRINALAESSDGFVWRLKDEGGNATQIRAYDDPLIIVNLSVWRSPEDLYGFAYKTAHRRFVQRRKEWFELFDGPYLALWWVDEVHRPDVREGQERLTHLERFGPTAWAFNFRKAFPADPAAVPLAAADEGRTVAGPWRLCS